MSALLVLGLSHRTAPLEARERAALPEPAARRLLGALREAPDVAEAVVLSTCNRTEVYAVAGGAATLARELVAHTALTASELEAVAFVKAGEDAVRHLFRVAAGLDSMVLGEPEIRAQVRRAVDAAAGEGMLGPRLAALFRAALGAGRRVRARTGIGRGAMSTSAVTVELARRALGDLAGCRALFVGAGKMAEATARALLREGVSQVTVANRTPAAAEELAARLGGRGVGLGALRAELAGADLVVACTDAPGPVVRRADVAGALAGRRKPLVCIDIAVPRDVEPAVAGLDGALVLDLDDLRRVAAANRAGRELEARRAEAIVATEVRRFVAGPAGRAAGATADAARPAA